MKLRIAMLLMLVMSVAAMAAPDENTLGGFIFWCTVYAFMTPFGWGALIVLIYVIVTMTKKASQTVASTDYSLMKEEEKEVLMKQELRTAYRDLRKF